MNYYADTSALMKLYLDESGSSDVIDILGDATGLISSALTHLELVSSIEFAKRIRRINSPVYRAQFSALEMDVRKGMFTFINVSPSILKRAIPLIRVHRLKSPDAIQLATALESNRRYAGEIHFLCADLALLGAARSEGLRCKDVSR